MNLPPPVPLNYRKESIAPAPEGPIQNVHLVPLPWWQNRRYWAVGGLSLAALTGVAFAMAQSGRVGNEGIYQSENPAPNYENVIAAAQDRLSGNYQDSRLVLDDVARSVLENEAYRYRCPRSRPHGPRSACLGWLYPDAPGKPRRQLPSRQPRRYPRPTVTPYPHRG